jgi:hypothetical protein
MMILKILLTPITVNFKRRLTGVQTGLGQQIADVGTQFGQQLTGLGTQFGQQLTGLGTQIGQQISGVQTGLQAQIQRGQQEANVTQLFNMLSQPGAVEQKVEVKTPDPVRLGPMFDISGESIFGSGQQPFTPYAAGGAVNYDEITDELVRIIRG